VSSIRFYMLAFGFWLARRGMMINVAGTWLPSGKHPSNYVT
jgi:hypothetical protein